MSLGNDFLPNPNDFRGTLDFDDISMCENIFEKRNIIYSLMAYYMKIRLEIRVSLFCSEINFENFRQINGNFTDATIFPLPRQRK